MKPSICASYPANSQILVKDPCPLVLPELARCRKDHINTRILQTMISGMPLKGGLGILFMGSLGP